MSNAAAGRSAPTRADARRFGGGAGLARTIVVAGQSRGPLSFVRRRGPDPYPSTSAVAARSIAARQCGRTARPNSSTSAASIASAVR